MTARLRLVLVLGLCLVGAMLSALLLAEHRGEGRAASAVNAICGEGQQSGCEEVNRSAYSEWKGVPLAAAGLSFYLALAFGLALVLVAGAEMQAAVAVSVLAALCLALVADAVLLAIQAFAIKAFCKLCLATYGVSAAAVLLLWPARAQAPEVRRSLALREGRMLGVAWLLGVMSLLAAVAGADQVLRYREQRRMASLLGTPSPAPDVQPAPASAPSATEPPAPGDAGRYQEEARQARDQARKLQEILDDPEKLQQYLTDKAAHEFEATPVQNIDLSHAPSQGPAAAPIRVVTFSDFLCPWCRNLAQGLSGFLPQAAGRVQLVFKNYPLDQTCNENVKQTIPGHAGSCWLAFGGICAHEQNRFWPYHDKVFGSTLKEPTREDVMKIAGELGLDVAAFGTCLGSPQPGERVTADLREGHTLGVGGTPTVFVNGKKLANINSFMIAIERESKRLGLPPLQPPRGN